MIPPTRRPRRRRWPVAVAVVLVVVLAIAGIGSYAVAHGTAKTETFTVTRVLDQPTSSTSCQQTRGSSNCTTTNSHQYLIFTDRGTYKDTDSLWFWKFNSSDLIGQLKDGQRYTCLTSGFRISFASSYRNLIRCHPATNR